MGMVVRTNTMAINAQRQLNMNNNRVSKSLEKLASGYRINRAGDDAAGLAISEKMKAQIKGLETASLNAQDGISLVQTAEGNLIEVHNMLNRMVELATRAANGTFSDANRKTLQDEVDQLNEEIDRISQSANFNGMKLLDGSMGGKGATSAVSEVSSTLELGEIDAFAGKYELAAAPTDVTVPAADGDKISMNIGLDDGTSINVELTMKVDDKKNITFVDESGKVYGEVAATGTNQTTVTTTHMGDAFAAALKDKVGDTFKVSAAAGKITLEAKEKGASSPVVKSLSYGSVVSGTVKSKEAGVTEQTKAADAYNYLDTTKITLFDGTNADKAVFEVNGQKFAVGKIATDTKNLDDDVTFIGISTDLTTAADLQQIAYQIAQKTGLSVKHETTFDTDGPGAGTATIANALTFKPGTSTKASGGLVLQIGDTDEDYQQLNVSINDMSAKALGVASVNISKLKGAQGAIDTIRTAIDTVSAERAKLGAIQNRLDYTINNLDTTVENLNASNSRIRDTDMAKEMMEYTKMNVLVQSAQAMLAQANQQPQSVLQLLQ